MDLDAAFIGSTKGTFQKTPWKHDERAHRFYLQLMDAAYIGSNKGIFERAPWKNYDMKLDVAPNDLTKSALQKAP